MEGAGTVVGKLAPDFTLPDHTGGQVTLSSLVTRGPVLLVFYPSDFTMVCTKQLCNYSDNMSGFVDLGMQVIGISHNPVRSHADFATKYKFPFLLLTDLEHKVAKQYAATSLFMLGQPSRAVFIINQKRIILYRYVEPTVLTHRSASELLNVMQDLRKSKLL